MPAEDGVKSKLSVYSSGVNENKSAEKINISIRKCKNLSSQKPEGLTIYAKLDFNENQIAESQKITITTADVVPDLNFSSSMNVNVTDQTSVDDLAYKPVIITLIEVLPKEKKQKEEKIQNFGQAVFDLFPLIKGETNISYKVPVYPTPGSTLETQSPDLPLPEIEVFITIDQPLLSTDESNKSNLLTVTLESMYALPDSWNNNAKEYAYTVSLPIPLNDEKDSAVAFVNGLVKSTTDPQSKQKRWPDTRGILTPNAVFIPNAFLTEDQNAEEQGDFQSKEDKEYRFSSEKDKPKIVWNVERRCFLNNGSNNALREQLMKARYLPIEIIRTLVPTGAKGKKDEDLAMSYHGVAYIDMAPLLYPGATQIKGAFKVIPYSDSEYITKTKRKAGLVDETLKVVNNLFDRNFAIMPVKKEVNKVVEKKDQKNKNPRESNIDGHDISQSVAQLLEAKSFIVIDIKFEKPIIPRKPFEVLAKRVAELVPPRPKYPLRTNSAEKAVGEFHSQIKIILHSVLEDYRNLSFDDNEFLSSDNVDFTKKENEYEIRRRRLLYELNSTGKYFAFKEQLKNSVVKIVREKFLKTSALSDPEQLQQFLSELYVFLIDELHKSLNGILSVEDAPSIESSMTDMNQMKHFALEAEMNRNFDLAAYYYQERIATDKNNYSSWLDYAVFNLLIEDYARCDECLKECISINQNEISGLLLYSVICAMQEKYDLAETFLEKVTTQDSENVIGWTLLALLYEQKGQELNAEITIKKTLKLNQSLLSESNNLNASTNQISNDIDLEASMIKKDEEGTAEEDSASKAQENIPKSRTSKRGTLTQIPKLKNETSKSPKLGASAKNILENQSVLLKEKSMIGNDSTINKSVYLRTAKFLIKHNAFSWAEKCMAKELLNPNGGPNSQYHILLAKIKLAKNQLEEAERHITESLVFDYQSSASWILWGHVRYLLGDFKDAKEKYERVLLFQDLPSDQTHSIYIRLASIYLKEENYEDSKRLFLYPCKHTPSCMSWLGVGICCYRLSQLEEAKNALCEANILNNKAPEVWAYLSLICLRTNKPLEAEQAYKYAMKLNLDNPELLDEIHALQEKVGFGNPEF